MGVQIPHDLHPEVPPQGCCTGNCAGIWEKCFRKLAEQKESRMEEVHLMPDHVHTMIPSKYAVSQVVGFIKGKSAIHLGRTYGERSRNFIGQNFWARGYFISMVGRDEEVIRECIGTKKWTSAGLPDHL
jgi:REP element-mobilizing transposase RayT